MAEIGKITRRIGTSLAVLALLVAAYYVKSNVLHIDLIENRHLLFFEKPFETSQRRAEKRQLFKELLDRSMAGEQIGRTGKSREGDHSYQNENMYWAGPIHTVIDLPKGKAVIGIKARGISANGHYPYIVVGLDD